MDLIKSAAGSAGGETNYKEMAEKLLQENETLKKIIEELKAKLAGMAGDAVAGKVTDAAEDAGKQAADEAAKKAEEAGNDALGSMASMKKSLPF